MDRALRFALAALTLTAVGCNGKSLCSSALFAPSPGSQDSEDSPSAGNSKNANAGSAAGAPQADTSGAATRAISEADIVQLDDEQDRIYAMSRSGSLAIVDAATPGTLSLMGKTSLPGVPFEMYRRGNVLITMTNNAVSGDGTLQQPLPEDAVPVESNAASGAAISAVDVSNPSSMKTLATFKVAGEIADSRIVGNVLYLATYENVSCYSCGTKPRTLVTTFDVSTPTDPKKVDQVAFEASPESIGFNAAWSTPWKRSIIATTERLYVGGLAYDNGTTTSEGIIEVLDITDPTGKLVRGATIATSGPVMSRWQMDESSGVLRVISQHGAGRTQNGEQYPDVDTFRVESSASLVRVGHMTLELPRQEGLKTVRFDGSRGYAITFNQTDPLFTIDLSDPAKPAQKGQLQMPGWMFHLEPRGDKLIGLGLDRTDQTGNLNVSLFDVADLSNPTLLQRVSFGPTNIYEDYMITQGVLAEDQDRIQKAFRIDQDGLISVPFSAGTNVCGDTGTQYGRTPNGAVSGIQLLTWAGSSLTKRAMLPLAGNPRRAVRRDSPTTRELIAVSDSNVRSFSIDQLDAPTQTADLVIGKCVPRSVTPTGFGGVGEGRDYYYGDDTPRYPDHSSSSSSACE
jgi:hypothetical protein